ncbi:MAG: orotate phosphoribosyltransferase [Gammaproteobacteria bacterium]|nr:MAG: orotate phosphoribosyltransferase [Gammaproteobacteria bacterium]
MQDYQCDFIKFAIDTGVLGFGEFTLKSGRVSPYFFNAGLFNSGTSLARLGQYYARAIVDQDIDFDMLYGPAYKGIALAASTAIALSEQHQRNIPYAFNRKEAKQHAEGGIIIGAPLSGKVLIIDDVISSGISIREAVDIIKQQGGTPAGVIIALDRQERGDKQCAIVEMEQEFGLKIYSIVNLDMLVEYLQNHHEDKSHLQVIQQYRETYGESG